MTRLRTRRLWARSKAESFVNCASGTWGSAPALMATPGGMAAKTASATRNRFMSLNVVTMDWRVHPFRRRVEDAYGRKLLQAFISPASQMGWKAALRTKRRSSTVDHSGRTPLIYTGFFMSTIIRMAARRVRVAFPLPAIGG